MPPIRAKPPAPAAPSGFTQDHTSIADSALNTLYKEVSADRFGTTEVTGYKGKTHVVADLHYPTTDGLKMLLVPVSGDGKAKGYAALDAQIRRACGLAKDEPIYAFTSMLKPQEHRGTWQELATQTLKPDRGVHHMGAYIGEGKATNAPESYRWKQLSVAGSPANIHVVSMSGVPQATLNRNFLMVDEVLNEGVVFPKNYWEDDYVTTDLRTTLMFYRDWLLGKPELRDDPRFATYCSEHKLIVLNVAVNVPHHEQAFIEIFGAQDGPQAWAAFTSHFEKKNSRAFSAADETHFEPLWKRDGIAAEKLKIPSIAEFCAWDDARRAGIPTAGFRPMAATRGMAFAAEREADLIRDFVDTYCRFEDAGGVTAAAALWSFRDATAERMGISKERFTELAVPIAQKLIAAEARVQGPQQRAWLGKAVRELRDQLSSDFLPSATLEAFIKTNFSLATEYLTQQPGPAQTRAEAGAWLKRACLRDYVRARGERVLGHGKSIHYAPPAILHRIEMGQHTAHPALHFRTVATAVDRKELKPT